MPWPLQEGQQDLTVLTGEWEGAGPPHDQSSTWKWFPTLLQCRWHQDDSLSKCAYLLLFGTNGLIYTHTHLVLKPKRALMTRLRQCPESL